MTPPSRRSTRSSSIPQNGACPLPATTYASSSAAGAKRSLGPHVSESPAKKQSKWSPEEDMILTEVRGSGMKWEDISKRLPGRSAISCRLHYQNYLERRPEWDEERKNKLARLYERFKPEMWSKVATEMQIPWRAAEAMHWHLGEADMARRAGVVPFSLSLVTIDTPPSHPIPAGHLQHHHQRPPPHPDQVHQQMATGNVQHHSPPNYHRGHSHSHSIGSASGGTLPVGRYSRSSVSTPIITHAAGPHAGTRSLAARRESLNHTPHPSAATPRTMTQQPLPGSAGFSSPISGAGSLSSSIDGSPFALAATSANGLHGSSIRGSRISSVGSTAAGILPSVQEMTTGVTLASYAVPSYAPAYAITSSHGPGGYTQAPLAPSPMPYPTPPTVQRGEGWISQQMIKSESPGVELSTVKREGSSRR